MADSPSWIERIECRFRGHMGQGDIDVWVFVRCPDFDIAQGWYRKTCGPDRNLIQFLEQELGGHLSWERSSGPQE